jgi:hypothetical protein
MARKWKAVLPDVHPHELLRAFFGKEDFTNKNMEQMMLQVNDKDKKISLAATGSDLKVHGKTVKDYTRVLEIGKGVAHHEVLEVAKADQGGDLVKKLFKSVMPLYDKIGIKKISLYANIDRGGYAWGRYGFEYKDSEAQAVHQLDIKNDLAILTKNVVLNEAATAEKTAINKVLAKKDSKAIWALVDMKTPELDKAFKTQINKNAKKGSFIKWLTKDSGWDGTLDTSKNSPARKRLEHYIK